ncbi:MAG: acetyl-CoA hydrolase/transferase family protein [Lentisphaeria bacterium]|nr:acetyl-CoA hydrolase/transferase family protein [Lentisphaeria bacterium]
MRKTPVQVTAAEAVSIVKPHDNIYFSCFACTPEIFIEELCDYAKKANLYDVSIYQTLLLTKCRYSSEEYKGIFNTKAFFVGDQIRKDVKAGLAEYLPVAFNETPAFFRNKEAELAVAFIAVSPPDEHGYVSLGLSVDMTLAAVQSAKKVVAVINKHVPRTFGDALIPFHMIDMYVENDREVSEVVYPESSEIDHIIGKHCAELINDGDCLQMGIGSIPNAILSCLENHNHLGIHSEMFSDGVIPLVEKGIIDGSCKQIDQGKLVASFLMGSHNLHRFVHDNPLVLMKEAAYTNDPFIIAQNNNVVAINSAIEIDLTGQVCADSIGEMIYSGVGGQLDFVYGANRAKNGRAVIAMSSLTNKGASKIVPTLAKGAGVVTPRSMIHHFVTEYGRVDLYGKSLPERAKLLISVAHPSVRDSLEEAAKLRFGSSFKL